MKATELNNGAMMISIERNDLFIKIDNVEVGSKVVSRWARHKSWMENAVGIEDIWYISDEYYQSKVDEGIMIEVFE